ncbi:multiheme c-type cytochrome [Geomesophilobacter sediminis]|uniref:multiheme c-type cytochrome n=1 Tax=Geomesophilobacter sediminis TaxID=2798584 RepID=UPI002E2AD2A0|nr:multiheme c-type cytochrome [Geomesophilobacter sediminis]
MRNRFSLLVALATATLLSPTAYSAQSAAKPTKSECISCHEKVTPGIVKQFLSGKMGKKLDCSSCHGLAHKSANDAAKATLPTPETCAKCHPERVAQYRKGKHSAAWLAMKAMPMITHQPTYIGGGGMKGCSACHKVGEKPAADLKRYGSGACDSCHTRHSFSVAEARDPRACQTCHMGFDHPQWEMWQTSKHGTIWAIEPTTGRAPVCQTCHMPDGSHAVETAWGFLALRMPEEDGDWLFDRVTILKAIGVLDDNGKPTERFEAIQKARLARLTKEEFDRDREKMLTACSACHSKSFAQANLNIGDEVIRDADRIFAESIRTVKALYDEGLLKKPEGWKYAPDLLQFYEAKSSAEQELYLMFLEYRQRAFQGAFHSNPDYMQWYGWAKMKEAAARIQDDADRLRREKRLK